MKKLLLSAFFCFATCGLWASDALSVKVLRLHNGFTVWLNEDHSQPRVFGAVVVRAGARDCPGTGIAHYFEHILFKGTDKIGTVDYAAEKPWLDSISAQYDLLARTTDPLARSRIQRHINRLSVKAADYAIPNEFENLISTYGGTGLNAYTSFDETVFHNSFAPQYIAQWCELNSERLISPVFRLFQGELETVYEEKNMYSDNMLWPAAEALQRQALAGTPYAEPIVGTTENLKNPQLSAMRRFFNTYYVAGNMGLILAGDIQSDTLLPLLERTFGRIREGQVPSRQRAQLRSFRGMPALKVKLPIPVVKAAGYAFRAPDERSADYMPLKVMLAMLNNDARAGLLDSLGNAHLLMGAMSGAYDLKDFSAFGFGYIPRLPFGSRKKADRLCWQQMDKLRSGSFSDEMLTSAKLSLRRSFEQNLENMDTRSATMINAFSHGLSWDEVLRRSRQLEQVSRDDIVRVARRYINDDSLKVVKTYGSYPKEHVSQPGYQPVKPKNSGRRSVYAGQLAHMSFARVAPRLVDFARDATCRALRPLVNLYTVRNPQNDVFTLQLIYRRGTRNDRRIGPMAEYMDNLGTAGMTRNQLVRALRGVGASLSVSSADDNMTVSLTGFDHLIKPALTVLHEFLTCPKADKKAFNELVQTTKMEEKSFFKDNATIADAVFDKVQHGDSSSYLRRLSADDVKKLSAGELVALFRDVQCSQLDVVYTGRLDDRAVEEAVRQYVPIGQVERPWTYVSHRAAACPDPVVYVFDNPKARQTIIGTYQQLPAMRTPAERTRLRMWGSYFGGGMSSVLFQDIREFRSLAYSAHGTPVLTDSKLNPEAPCAFVSRLGTQSDKAMQALGVLDSLFAAMPVRPANIASTRQHIVNVVNNSYPDFRSIGSYIARQRLYGHSEDPDKDVVSTLSAMGVDDVTTFYRQYVQGMPRAIIVVGNKKNLDLQRLSKLGRIVELGRSDIYHVR